MIPLTRSVLVVDDEEIIAELWCINLEKMGVDVCGTAATAEEAVDMARRHRPAVVLMDMRLRGQKDGVDAALEIHASVGSKTIFITGSTEPRTRKRIDLDHPVAVLIKPVPEHLFRSTVSKVFLDSAAHEPAE
jgi:CheY-like chemotaxis protein